MKRSTWIAIAIASVLVIAFAYTVFAQTSNPISTAVSGRPGYGLMMRDGQGMMAGRGMMNRQSAAGQPANGARAGQGWSDQDGDGQCDNFVDENGDGVCDLAGSGAGRGAMMGGRSGMAGERGGMMGGRGGMMAGRGAGHGPNFTDADGDGVCDNFTARTDAAQTTPTPESDGQ